MEVIWLEPGHPPIPTDQHAHDQTMFVFSGGVQLVLNGADRYVVKPGGVPVHPRRRATVLGEEPLHALNIFAPVQPRYLPMVEHQLANEALSAGGSSRCSPCSAGRPSSGHVAAASLENQGRSRP